jgi:two-component system sensor histidine kinase QseC
MKRKPSLFRHLVAWTLGSLLLVWAAFVFFAYRTGMHEADELTDGHLASVASLLLTQNVTSFSPAPTAASLGGASALRAHDYQQSLSVFIWNREGTLVARTGEAPEPTTKPGDGFVTVAIGQPPVQWRAFSRWNGPGQERRVTVMLNLEERDGLAEDIAEQVREPGLWLLPVVALLLVLAIRRGLRPLDDLRRQVDAMDIHRNTPLAAPPHEEFAGIVTAISTLRQRYDFALARERDLASELAHELRTPLTSITLNADSLRSPATEADREKALQRICEDAGRAAAVIADLMALAGRTGDAGARRRCGIRRTQLAVGARAVTVRAGGLHRRGPPGASADRVAQPDRERLAVHAARHAHRGGRRVRPSRIGRARQRPGCSERSPGAAGGRWIRPGPPSGEEDRIHPWRALHGI